MMGQNQNFTTTPQKNYLPGGIILCVFPAMIFFLIHLQNIEVPLHWLILLALLFVSGIWAMILSLFKLDEKGALSCVVGSIIVAGIAVMFFVVAWREKDGWSGGIPFIPRAWNQVIPRLLFALGGLLAAIGAFSLLRRAVRKHRKV
jgi:hypothetical protein